MTYELFTTWESGYTIVLKKLIIDVQYFQHSQTAKLSISFGIFSNDFIKK